MSEVFYPRLIKRVRASLIDSLIILAVAVGIFALGGAFELTTSFRVFSAIVTAIMLEPVLVAFTGGSFGHHLMKIKVTKKDGVTHINILASSLRFLVKLLLGWFTFISIFITRRHQAIHDVLVNSIVVHKNITALPVYEILGDRATEKGFKQAPVWRRLLVIFTYCVVVVIVVGLLFVKLSSVVCLELNRCSKSDLLIDLGLNIIFIVAIGTIIFRGWTGKLFGCRKKSISGI